MTIKIDWNMAEAIAEVDRNTKQSMKRAALYMQVHCMTSHVVGWGWRTGDLARSYRVEEIAEGQFQKGYQLITDGIFYAGFVEKGTSRMPAQKHMVNAAEATAAKFGGGAFV